MTQANLDELLKDIRALLAKPGNRKLFLVNSKVATAAAMYGGVSPIMDHRRSFVTLSRTTLMYIVVGSEVRFEHDTAAKMTRALSPPTTTGRSEWQVPHRPQPQTLTSSSTARTS